MLLGGPAFCLLGLAGSLLTNDVELRIEFATIAVFVGLLMLGVPLAFASRHWLRAARALSQDARSGRVDCFDVDPPPPPPPEERSADETALSALEILPRSGLVWRIAGERPAGAWRMERRSIANLPAVAGIAAEWVEPTRTRHGEIVHLNRRDLSPAERAELARRARRLAFGPSWVALIPAAWFAGVLIANLGRASWGEQAVGLAIPGIVTGVAIARLVRDLRLAGKLRRDGGVGQVVIVRSPTGSPDADALGPPMEYLAVSGILWTSSGAPAGWRGTPGHLSR